ncbi:Dipeptide-binding ABC transporter, periplasmic substrate-binding component [Methylophaga thiooxydans]|uniref:Dipeptide-binding ABC transporter, periplasmic substrate-binding component n=1 Tax=Methylophaga thiooxydans TaxID=392484 RepID=A0A0A0BIN3_9GAMM|nr:ABC transporter substrate-binding protein [Methylophaga thiooxydans]KGM06979.1 Dipeptide-binding ABC transporter, periplasmic substrate-binding component [Methylophaga thiooxydans]
MTLKHLLVYLLLGVLTACNTQAVNSPYPDQDNDVAVLYSSFSLRPKHLDPARSYSSNEIAITGQIYEPPYQYHYLKRPYELEPLAAEALPDVKYLDAQGNTIKDAKADTGVAFTVYTIPIKSGIFYQPHPAFATDENGTFLYHQLTPVQLDEINEIADFEQTDTRELRADDFVYQIKRLAHPEIHSPILGLMGEHIVGLTDYAQQLRDIRQQGDVVDLRAHDIEGVKVLDNHHYQITVYGKYPQLRFWLAMPFFAPIPWEAEQFYSQAGLIEKNITIDWYPVGTGPFYMTENDPNQRMVLSKNPHFHGEYYPSEGEPEDARNGLLNDAGKPLPMLDKIVFSLEKENTSYWGKFIQGYYDVSGISSDSFDQAVQVSSSGEFGLSDSMKEKGIQLETAVGTSTFYIGFNMLDPIVGGNAEKAKKLRRAISIAIDHEEYISIFANGRGIPAQGPVPPGIFGYVEGEKGINPYTYRWENNEPVRRTLDDAKQLLAEAGYPKGRNAKTGEPLVLYFDVPASGPDSKAQLDWLRKQFRKLNVQLVIRSTDYNRFQDKIRRGQAQIFQWGWNADYPDPENFLFLLYGPNGKVDSGGENASNYSNPAFDALFEKMRAMPNNAQRQHIIEEMVAIAREDAPWVWGFHPKQFTLFHAWNHNVKSNLMANNTLKYRRLDTELRQELQTKWNQPLLWPLLLVLLVLVVMVLPAALLYRHKKYKKPT